MILQKSSGPSFHIDAYRIGVRPHYGGTSTLFEYINSVGVCPHYRGMSSLLGYVQVIEACPHYLGTSTLLGYVT